VENCRRKAGETIEAPHIPSLRWQGETAETNEENVASLSKKFFPPELEADLSGIEDVEALGQTYSKRSRSKTYLPLLTQPLLLVGNKPELLR